MPSAITSSCTCKVDLSKCWSNYWLSILLLDRLFATALVSHQTCEKWLYAYASRAHELKLSLCTTTCLVCFELRVQHQRLPWHAACSLCFARWQCNARAERLDHFARVLRF